MRGSGHTTIDTWRFILDWALSHKGNTPSMRQIAKGCDFSQDTAHVHVHILIAQGVLRQIDGDLCIVKLRVSAPKDIYDLPGVKNV